MRKILLSLLFAALSLSAAAKVTVNSCTFNNPASDLILYWNNTSGSCTAANIGTGLSLSAGTLSATGGASYWNASGNNIYNNNPGFVGVNQISPIAQLHVSYPFVGAPTGLSATLTQETPLTPPTDSPSLLYGPRDPSSASSSENVGSSGYTCNGQTNNYTVYAYKIINGTNYISPVGAFTSVTDFINDGSTTFSVSLNWSAATTGDGSPVDGYWIQGAMGSKDVGNTTSYNDDGTFDGTFYGAFNGIVATGQTLPFDIFDYAGAYYSANGGTASITDLQNNGSHFWVVHNITGSFTNNYDIQNHGSSGYVFTTDNPYYQTGALGGTNTPTPQLIQSNGSTLNRDYEVDVTNLANDAYKGVQTASISDPNDGNWYFISLSASGGTYYKYLRNINGAGFNSAQLSGGSLYDDINTSWADSLTITPQNSAANGLIVETGNSTFNGGNPQIIAKGIVPEITMDNGSAHGAGMAINPSNSRMTILPSNGNDLIDIWSNIGNFAPVQLGFEDIFNVSTNSGSFEIDGQFGRFFKLQGFTAEFAINTQIDSCCGFSTNGSFQASGQNFFGGTNGFFGASPRGQESGDSADGLVAFGLFSSANYSASHITGQVAAANGGTGIGSYTVGDLLYASASTTLSKLADVAAGSFLRSGGASVAPAWSTLILPNSATQGDMPYSNSSNQIAMLAKNTTATRYISNTGTSNNPAWAQVNLTNGVTGTLPAANLPTASSSVLGLVQGDGSTITINGSGVESCTTATSSQIGCAKFGTGLSVSAGNVTDNAESTVTFQPGQVTAIVNVKGAYTKFLKASTVDNIVGSATAFTCTGNPVITMFECGVSSTCASSPVTIGTVTITASGTKFDGTVSNGAIAAGDYVAFSVSSGTCTAADIYLQAQYHSN